MTKKRIPLMYRVLISAAVITLLDLLIYRSFPLVTFLVAFISIGMIAILVNCACPLYRNPVVSSRSDQKTPAEGTKSCSSCGALNLIEEKRCIRCSQAFPEA